MARGLMKKTHIFNDSVTIPDFFTRGWVTNTHASANITITSSEGTLTLEPDEVVEWNYAEEGYAQIVVDKGSGSVKGYYIM